MDANSHLKLAAVEKRKENLILSLAYTNTLAWLIPANFILVVGAALLSLVAGATILIANNWLTPVQSGLLALVSGAFTIVHSKLGCEQYQGECRKLSAFHRGMAADYGNLRIADDVEELKKRMVALNEQLSAALKSATASPFDQPSQRRSVRCGDA
jgi:hypothetical protein